MTPADQLPTPTPGPASGVRHDVRKELDALRLQCSEMMRRLEELTKDFSELSHGHDEHEDRLDDHDRKIDSLSEGQREIRSNLHKLTADVYRFADAVSVQAMTLERQEKTIASFAKTLHAQEKQLGGIASNTSRVLDLLQPKATL